MKNTLIKMQLFILLVIMAASNSIIAQNNIIYPDYSNFEYETWQLYKQINDIDIYFKYAYCDDIKNGFISDFIHFKLINRSNDKLYVVWNYDFTYNNIKRSNRISDEKDIDIYIIHSSGRIVHKEHIKNAESKITKEFDISSYASGIYFIKIGTDKGISLKKIIVY